ncbi:MAG TPA: hypothetical protein VLF66_01580, partial [Thermoanaerobaculia bacterium]|nr:hypothetical protein [Thermoanaerobaculia bacterium]
MDRRDPPDLPKTELEDLLAGVLARTTGPVCGRAHELLPDEDLPDTDRRLLALHLEGCPGCRALAAALAALAEDLHALAEVAPEPGFLEGVLARTSRAAPAVPALDRRARRLAPSLAAFAGAWRRASAVWVRRPRFAWEAAFVLTLVLSPVFAAAAAPLQERAVELRRENPVARLEAPMAGAEERLEAAGRSLAESEAARWLDRRLDAGRAAVQG